MMLVVKPARTLGRCKLAAVAGRLGMRCLLARKTRKRTAEIWQHLQLEIEVQVVGVDVEEEVWSIGQG